MGSHPDCTLPMRPPGEMQDDRRTDRVGEAFMPACTVAGRQASKDASSMVYGTSTSDVWKCRIGLPMPGLDAG